MTQKQKCFYEQVDVESCEHGFMIVLDGRSVRTPAKRHLCLPTHNLAKSVAAEFRAQCEKIDPVMMPLTRLANTVIDGIADHPQPIIEDIMRFIAADMLFYRASEPLELIERQRAAFDPILDFIAAKFSSRFEIGEGVSYIIQPREAYLPLSHYLNEIVSPFILGAMHTITTLTGSGLLAIALREGEIDGDGAWQIAHLDEDWTIEHWGQDEEAMRRRHFRRGEFDSALTFLTEALIN